jgi:hypothetical protein
VSTLVVRETMNITTVGALLLQLGKRRIKFEGTPDSVRTMKSELERMGVPYEEE